MAAAAAHRLSLGLLLVTIAQTVAEALPEAFSVEEGFLLMPPPQTEAAPGVEGLSPAPTAVGSTPVTTLRLHADR